MKPYLRIVRYALAVVGVALVSLPALGATSASAAKSDCPANRMCLWTGPDFTGTMTHYKVQGSCDLGCWYGVGEIMNNNASSVYNRVNLIVYLSGRTASDANANGPGANFTCVNGSGGARNLTSMNNLVSSYEFSNRVGSC